MAIAKQLIRYIEDSLSINIIATNSVSGGSINDAYRLQTSNKSYFIKVNDKHKHPGMFEAEAKGLKIISETNTIAVPGVVLTGAVDDQSFLLLEWLDPVSPDPETSQLLGRQLAEMHRCTTDQFGLDHDNYMGSLPQSNKRHFKWSSFFIEERLQPMVKIAADKGYLNSMDVKNLETLYNKLPGLFSGEPPALIHGDLWSGNYLISASGKPYLIDPALCYGHREFDIAMTTLFGGFLNEFYRSYNDEFPLAEGWEQRIDLWNLYPLLLHLNLLGVGYLRQVRTAVGKYI